MVLSANLGFPRIGANRELKKSLESFWKGNSSQEELLSVAKDIRAKNWKLQKDNAIDYIPSNDFSLYDQILDTISMIGAIPKRYDISDNFDLKTYFAMARGYQNDGQDVTAMEMTKWFDTNYHYIVPEFDSNTQFEFTSKKIVDEYLEAKELGIETRPVIVGPVTLLLLGKSREEGFSVLSLLPKLLEVYKEILGALSDAGAEFVQIDEPCLVLDLDEDAKNAYKAAYEDLSSVAVKLFIATYFGALNDNKDLALSLPSYAIHIDLVRGNEQLGDVIDVLPEGKKLSIGLVDGRNIWKTDLDKALSAAKKAVDAIGSDRLIVGPSCSLLHSPVDLDCESTIDDDVKSWLAFATQKLKEISVLSASLNGDESVDGFLADNAAACAAKKTSSKIHNSEVKDRVSTLNAELVTRKSQFSERIKVQRESLSLPLLPTTTIGSFPQTKELRAVRSKFKKQEISREEYDEYIKKSIDDSIKFQNDIGIDVLVHGEFERNDMVEYFGEKLNGFAFTKNGWVQSYGSRCVKPPIIFGDVSRSEPMTVRWSQYAQSVSDKHVKGMLTGPVTILQWSFVRNDQPRSETCKQIAFAIRDEVLDLESAGIKIIQIDEAALREGLPLRKGDWEHYLNWAVESFHISADGVKDETQIHTHMCYSEFNDIIEAVADMDADVISIETSRSAMELLDAFVEFKYPNEIGPGVYDIHSPRVPKTKEMEKLLYKALDVLDPEQVWVNPDCGLKTRGWPEVEEALRFMVDATVNVRKSLQKDGEEAVNA